jgi:hypothetical protein
MRFPPSGAAFRPSALGARRRFLHGRATSVRPAAPVEISHQGAHAPCSGAWLEATAAEDRLSVRPRAVGAGVRHPR